MNPSLKYLFFKISIIISILIIALIEGCERTTELALQKPPLYDTSLTEIDTNTETDTNTTPDTSIIIKTDTSVDSGTDLAKSSDTSSDSQQ